MDRVGLEVISKEMERALGRPRRRAVVLCSNRKDATLGVLELVYHTSGRTRIGVMQSLYLNRTLVGK